MQNAQTCDQVLSSSPCPNQHHTPPVGCMHPGFPIRTNWNPPLAGAGTCNQDCHRQAAARERKQRA
jgi:hypothetical protein